MATKRTYMGRDGRVRTFTKNHTYMSSSGAVVSERLIAVTGVTLIAQAKATNRFIFSRIHGRVN